MSATDFGTYIRELREKKKISLRHLADMIKVTPSYLSKVERGEFAPPGEEKVVALSKELGVDADELLAMAGKVATDLMDFIRKSPSEMAAIIRFAGEQSKTDLSLWARNVSVCRDCKIIRQNDNRK